VKRADSAAEYQVPAEGEAHASTRGHAVDRHDHRLLGPGQARDGAVQVRRQLLDVGADAAEVVDERLDVTAGAERLAGARDDDRAHRRVVVDLEDRVKELPAQREVERVERIGTAQRDGGHAVRACESHRVVGHARLL